MNHEDSEPEHDEFRPKPITRFLTIPEIFHSVQKDAPFANCLACGADLLTSNRYYVIEKVFRGTEVIIELAMCLNCRSGQSDEGMSEASAAAVEKFLTERVDFQRRLELMSTVNDSDSIDPWLERCVLSDNLGQTFREYQLIALCRGPRLQRDFYPALISGPAIEELSDLLSDETREWLDDFVGNNFGLPSEFCQPPSFTPVLF